MSLLQYCVWVSLRFQEVAFSAIIVVPVTNSVVTVALDIEVLSIVVAGIGVCVEDKGCDVEEAALFIAGVSVLNAGVVFIVSVDIGPLALRFGIAGVSMVF